MRVITFLKAPRAAVTALLLLGMTAGLTAGFSTSTQAQTAPIPQVVVVNIQSVLERTKSSADLQRQLDDANETNEAAIAPLREALAAKQEQLRIDRPSLTDQVFQQRRTALDAEIKAFTAEVERRRTTLEGKMRGSMDKIRGQLQAVVLEIAQERGANLILAKASVILMAPEFDVTEAALKRLDEKFPTATLE